MKFNRNEQETIIRYDAITKEWEFYSCVPSHIKSFIKNPSVKEIFEILTEHEGKPTSIRFKLEKTLVKNQFIKKKRTLSEEHLEALQNGRQKAAAR